MAASYPSSVKSFPTITAGVTEIQAVHPTASHEEIAAIEQGLLNGLQHHSKPNTTNTYDLATTSVRWRNLYLSGLIDVTGLGTHVVSATGSGANVLRVSQGTAGTANSAQLQLGSDVANDLLTIFSTASTYTPSADLLAAGVTLRATGAGGLNLASKHASGFVDVYIGATPTQRAKFDATFLRLYAETTEGRGFRVQSTSTNNPYIQVTLEDLSGTQAGRITVGDDSNFNPLELKSTSALAGANGTKTVPYWSRMGDEDTGLYFPAANQLQVSTADTAHMLWKIDNSKPLAELPAGAYGTGAVIGSTMLVGNNTSGGGAPGCLALTDKGGVIWFIWVDSTGDLRVSTSQPTETAGDTIGTVVGTQS